MPVSIVRTTLSLLVCCGLAGTAPLAALEGGYPSSHPDWQQTQPHQQPDATTRKAELVARREAIAAEIERLQARLQRVPPAAKMQELHGKLQQIDQQYGWVPEHGVVYGRRCIEPMLKGQNTNRKKLLAAFVQLNEDLQARDIDLIVLPLVPTPHFHAHLLVDGIDAEHEYYPGWTEMMIEMLEHDIEVVDSVSEFRTHADDEVLVSWVNDFHTGSRGRQLAAKKLAERLQRYDFARELRGNVGSWQATAQEKTGASFPQRITMVNRMFRDVKKGQVPAGAKTWPDKHPRKVTILNDDAPDISEALAQRRFKYLDLDRPGQADQWRRTDLVMIGDSQLHSAVYGSGLPEFINSEIGGVFRWGSKSWRGFSPPEIYREVVPDGAVQPRVVVLAFLPKYFWHKYKRNGEIDEDRCKYKPRPLPPLAGGARVADRLPSRPFEATVTITRLSQKPTEDASRLDYDEALMHVAATVDDGPLAGREIGLRYWILHDGVWTTADGVLRQGQQLKLTLQDWQSTIAKDGSLAQHEIFNDTDQPLTVPVFWITEGAVAPGRVLGR